jgi:hypothetical protein
MYRYGGGGPTYLKAGVAYIHDKKRTPLVGEGGGNIGGTEGRDIWIGK